MFIGRHSVVVNLPDSHHELLGFFLGKHYMIGAHKAGYPFGVGKLVADLAGVDVSASQIRPSRDDNVCVKNECLCI